MKKVCIVIALACVAGLGGCAQGPDVGATRAAVQNGTHSDVAGVVWVADPGGGSTCGGVVVGDRWVVSPSFCTGGDTVAVILEEDLRAGTPISALRVHTGPEITIPAGTATIDLVEMAEPLGVTPIELSDAVPMVDDLVTVIGFGQSSMAGSMRTEGTFRVTEVTDDTFTTVPEGDVAACYTDHPVFDSGGRLAGINLAGSMHPMYEGCFETGTAARVSFFRDFIQTTIAAAPDAGVGPADSGTGPADSGTGPADSGPPVADGGMAGDAGMTGGDGGCGCATAGASRTAPGAALLAFAVGLGLFLRRRRR